MISHLSLGVSDLEASGRFYDAVLAPLGWVRVWTSPKGLGYGPPGGNDKLALFPHPHATRPLAAGPGTHLALAARGPDAVYQCHAAALEQGGTDQGAAGLRPDYGAAYVACFFLDPDGHKIEVVHQ